MHIMTADGWRALVQEEVYPAGETPTLLQTMGIREESTADEYCEVISMYLAPLWSNRRIKEWSKASQLLTDIRRTQLSALMADNPQYMT